MCLVVVLICSTLALAAAAQQNALEASGVSRAMTSVTISERVTDPDTSADMGFVDVPRVHDGRIWTDKSVNAGTGDDDFIVTLSALSQSFPITEGYAIPVDTVFVIDVSGSMGDTDPGAGASRISILVDALNEAIGILQDANPQNRVAVVAYGGVIRGYARVENVLALGRYTAPEGAFFSVASTTVSVAAVPVPNSGGSRIVSSLQVEGSTPTQWGIYYGSRILEQADTTAIVDVTDSSGAVVSQVTVTRRPNIILMTDGEPTMGWTNYTFDPAIAPNPLIPGPSGVQIVSPSFVAPALFIGDGMYGELGISTLTVLTAAHRKQQIFNNYFSGVAPGGAPYGVAGQPGASVGFYTIGLGVQPTEAATILIRATMDPFNTPTNNNADAIHSDIRVGMNLPSPYTNNPYADPSDPTMGDLLRDFASPGASIAFNAQRRQVFATYVWDAEQMSVSNTVGLTLENLDFTTAYFEATDLEELRDAFQSITTSIQIQSTDTVTNVPGESPDFDGWLVFSDVLGEYMEFRGEPQLVFDGTSFSRAGFDLMNTAVRSTYETILYQHLNYGVTSASPYYVNVATVSALIQTNITAGNTTSIIYYADANRNFVGITNPGNAAARVEVFPMFGTLGTPIISGGQTDLMYITFHVVTALQSGTFTEIFSNDAGAQVPMNRILGVGDQLIRWYIPASLIPMRTVDFVNDAVVVSGNTSPIRVSYVVGLNQPSVLAGVSAAYKSVNMASDGSLYFYSNRWRDDQNVTLAFDEPHPNNPFYLPGRPGFGGGRDTIMKTSNPTGTAAHVSFERSFMYGPAGAQDLVGLNWLGNNGRLSIVLPSGLMITKTFIFDGVTVQVPPNDLQFTTPLVFTLLDSSENVAAVLNFPADFEWIVARNRWELTAPIELPPGTYTVTKTGGAVSGYMYLPQPEVGIVTILPDTTASIDFTNEYLTLTPPEQLPALRVIKRFYGLTPGVFPEGFQVVIEGPAGETPPNADGNWVQLPNGHWEIRLNHAQAIAGAYLRNLSVGQYRITEVNYNNLSGFNFINAQWVVVEADRGLMGYGTGTDSLPIVIDIEAQSDVAVRLENYYEAIGQPPPPPEQPSEPPQTPPDPPRETPWEPWEPWEPREPQPPRPPVTPPETPTTPQEPPTAPPEPPTEYPEPPTEPSEPPPERTTPPPIAPQTGDYRQTTLYIVLLLIGLSSMGGVVVYWLRKKLFYQGKHL